ncbi:MAG TPA: type I 3-dehydroquinate dehydratase [Thermoplasmata archaeon]|nr:type I 3-dehydroquinate dehydratase [Thermoplasmata archaeon]
MSRPRLCVTLPARTVEGARAGIAAARRDGADLVEIRFDRWSEAERARAGELFPAGLPLVATFRSVAEGGEGSVDPTQRHEFLERLAHLPFLAIDREVARDASPTAARASSSVGSRHLATPVDWTTFPELARRGHAPGEIGKIVAPATVGEFLHHLLPGPGPVVPDRGIIHSTGPSGPLSRVWASALGSTWVFAAPGPHDPNPGAPVEPSQLPVDRLATVLGTDPPGPLYGVLGHPVAHSGSPGLHHAWMRAEGLPGAYLAIDVETEREFRDLLDRMGAGGFRGLNVTYPWKTLALAVASQAEPAAVQAGAANCLTWNGQGWAGALTDVEALERRLTELRRARIWNGSEITVLGSGGAARATLVAARHLGASARVRARRPGAVDELRHRFPETVVGPAREAGSLVVHATSAQRTPDNLTLAFPIDDLLSEATHVIDLVYAPIAPTLAETVDRAGASYEDGRRVLRYQAEESYRRWQGHLPPASEEPAPPEGSR